MLFWKFQEQFFDLLSFIIKGDFESINNKKSKREKIKENLKENEILVEYDGERYKVNLDSLVTVPQNRNLRKYVDENYKDFLFHVFERYKKFVELDQEYIPLLVYGKEVIGADEKRVYNGLKECYEFFIEHEEYEYAAKAKELIEQMEDG